MNTVGTFGIASASYYWSRVAGAIGRLLQCLSGHTTTSWHMLVAGDYPLECGGAEYRSGLLLFVVGVPLSWHKTCGGDTLVWVGCEILLRSVSGGPRYRAGLLLFFVLCAVVGVPLSWHKTCGGDTLVLVGFEVLLRSRCVGISSRRAEWFVRWAENVLNDLFQPLFSSSLLCTREMQ